MIVTDTSYGVALTDDFGGFYKPFRAFRDIKPHDGYEDEDGDWTYKDFTMESFCASCPSAEDNQFVLGININLNKNINLEEIHTKWLDYMEKLPQEVKDIISEIKKSNPNAFEPDIQVLSGEC